MEKSSSKPVSAIKTKPFYRRDPITTILLAFGVFILSQLVAAVVIWLYSSLQGWSEVEVATWLDESISAQFFYVLMVEAIAIYMILWLLRRAHVTIARIGLVKPQLRDVGYALIAYGLYYLSYLFIVVLVINLIPSINVDQEQQLGFENAFSGAEMAMVFVSLVLLPPIAEEIIFRGFLFTSLRAKYRLRYTIIITSILFGVAHLQFGAGAPLLWIAAIDTFVLSCYLGLLRERTGSLWPPITLHFIKNGIAFAILYGPRILS